MSEQKIELTIKEWELIRDGWADVACWHHGFASAKPNYEAPPQLEAVSDLISHIKNRLLK